MAKNGKSAPVGDFPRLVVMQKDLQMLEVHPTCVKAHEAVGWKVVPLEVLRSELPEEVAIVGQAVEPEDEQPAE